MEIETLNLFKIIKEHEDLSQIAFAGEMSERVTASAAREVDSSNKVQTLGSEQGIVKR